MVKQFPQGFLWGTATASFQIEGYTTADGRGESIWDRFCATQGAIENGDTGEPACESYVRYPEDIAIMRDLGANAYRISIAWPRIIPDGDGAVNSKGLDYYSRLVDALLDAGIRPFVTLYHWDLPQALQDKGGWTNRATIDTFARYTDIAVGCLGDRVKDWATFNEPWCVAFLSHEIGEHAPGMKNRKVAIQVAHNVLVAHGTALPVIRQRCPDGRAGIVLNMEPTYPMMDTEADHHAAELNHQRFNRWFLDPIMGRGYPALAWASYAGNEPEIRPGDMDIIARTLDYLGINYYSRKVVHAPSGSYQEANLHLDATQDDAKQQGHVAYEGRILHHRDEDNVSARGWEVYPQGLYDLLTWVHTDYPGIPAFFVTENGIAWNDVVAGDGHIHDPERIAFLKQHFEAAHHALEDGVPLRGYFVWTLMDNFEWAFGTSSRFGLTYVDFDTQQRTLKDSGRWFGQVTRANAIVD